MVSFGMMQWSGFQLWLTIGTKNGMWYGMVIVFIGRQQLAKRQIATNGLNG